MSGIDQSGRSPDFAAKQRSREDVSSAAAASRWAAFSRDHDNGSAALYTGGSAPLPARQASNVFTNRPLHTADDVAVILRVPRSLVYALARRGELPAVRIGERYVRFRAEAIERWTEAREEWPQPPVSSDARGRIARTSGSPPTANRGASGNSLRRRTNAPEPGIRRVGPDAS
jgi:excisionase family DNA binding protein